MASRGVNKVVLVGRLGKDPEMRQMSNGKSVTNITVATGETWKDKETGQDHERTEWHKVVFFNRLAEIAGKYLKKGAQIYLEGSIRTRKWQDQEGKDRYSTEIIATEMQMLGGKDTNQQSAPVQQEEGVEPHTLRPDPSVPEEMDDIPF